ncbi:adenosine kinase 1-like protein [Dinothrombium tinctorium]|uniref:Adenosine kinase n=1 Tax=Dinothrombium tinctorium TaxID=1965070 RepID=A0A443RN38_9ACAR|nr:adenosine kinase 1-like protein [Dinothrombium tinctorium]
MADSSLREALILGLGNPLLDVSTTVSKEFLDKWGLEPNNAILATDQHQGLVEDLTKNYEVKFIAGGSVQNTMRIIQWLFSKPKVCTFMGCIGNDFFGRCMEFKATEDGVRVVYMTDPKEKTGHCVVLITENGQCRSMCAFLGAANNFKKDHLVKNWEYAEKAKYFYVSGFHIPVSLPSILELANHANSHQDKRFCFNLSAQYISQVFGEQLLSVVPFIDLLFGNETEAAAFAELNKWTDTKDLKEIAKRIANMGKANNNKPRIVIITQGKDPVIVAKQNETETKEYVVKPIEASEIVDTNGAGDAFVGGFLSQFVQDKSIEECVRVGIYAAQQIIRQDGFSTPRFPPQFDT